MGDNVLYNIGIEVAKPIIKEIVEVFIKPTFTDIFAKLRIEKETYKIAMIDEFQEYLESAYLRNFFVTPLALRSSIELNKIYVPLTLMKSGNVHQTESTSLFGRRKNKAVNHDEKKSFKINDTWADILDEHKKILIVDQAGMGKSTLTKFMFLQTAEKKVAIPLLIEARRIGEQEDILQLLSNMLGPLNKELDKNIISELVSAGNFIFFIDGLDEVSKDKKKITIDAIDSFISKSGKNIFIMASRPDSDLAKFSYFTEFNILPLQIEESYRLLKKYDIEGKQSKVLIQKLKQKQYEDVLHFLHNPLLCSLLFVTYSYKCDIPFKKHLYYRQLYDALYEKHDSNKPDPVKREKLSNLDIEQFDLVLRAFGFLTITNTQTEYDRDKCIDILGSCKKLFPEITYKESEFLYDIVKNVSIFIEDGLYFRWMHKSLQEYFAARFLCYNLKKDPKQPMTYLFKDMDKYYNVIDFCYDIDFCYFNKFVILPMQERFAKHFEKMWTKYSEIVAERQLITRIELTFSIKYIFRKRVHNAYVEDDFIEYNGLRFDRNFSSSKVVAVYQHKTPDYYILKFLLHKGFDFINKGKQTHMNLYPPYNALYKVLPHDQLLVVNEEEGEVADPTYFSIINDIVENFSDLNIEHDRSLAYQKKSDQSIRDEEEIYSQVFSNS